MLFERSELFPWKNEGNLDFLIFYRLQLFHVLLAEQMLKRLSNQIHIYLLISKEHEFQF